MNKYLYKIKDLEIPPWIKYWFAKRSKVNFDLSQILNGTSFDLTDTVNKKLHLMNIFGNSEQETTTGSQLLSLENSNNTTINEINFTIDKTKGEIIMNGTSSQTTILSINLNEVIPSGSIVSISNNNQQINNYVVTRLTTANGEVITGASCSLSNINSITENITLNKDAGRFQIRIPQNETLTNFIIKPMLNLGSSVLPWEPYTDGASPNPNYPQEVNSRGDNGYITENIVNKNLFNDKINLTQGFVNGNSGTITTSPNYKTSDYINIKWLRGKTIYINWSNNSDISYALYDINKTYISGGTNTGAIKNGILISSGAVYLRWTEKNTLYVEEMWSLSNNDNFEEHQEQVFTIPCQQPMRAIGDVKDTFVKENGVWYERHNINRISLKDFEFQKYEVTQGNLFRTSTVVNGSLEDFTVLSNIFIGILNSVGRVNNNIYYNSNNDRIDIICNDYNTIEDFETMLENKDGYVDIIRLTSLDLPCTQAQITALEQLQKAKTYKDVTHIYTDDEVPADLEIQYYKEKGE